MSTGINGMNTEITLDNNATKKCANCGHNVMVYHHPLSSSILTFHNNNGIFGRKCDCGCKNPSIKEEKIKNVLSDSLRMFNHIRIRHEKEYVDGKIVGFSMDRTRVVVSYFISGMDIEKDSPKTKVLNVDNIIETTSGYCEK